MPNVNHIPFPGCTEHQSMLIRELQRIAETYSPLNEPYLVNRANGDLRFIIAAMRCNQLDMIDWKCIESFVRSAS